MRFGRKEHTQASTTRPGLSPFTSATRHRGALTVVEPTISVALRVEAHPDRRDYGDAAEATPVGDPRSGIPRRPECPYIGHDAVPVRQPDGKLTRSGTDVAGNRTEN